MDRRRLRGFGEGSTRERERRPQCGEARWAAIGGERLRSHRSHRHRLRPGPSTPLWTLPPLPLLCGVCRSGCGSCRRCWWWWLGWRLDEAQLLCRSPRSPRCPHLGLPTSPSTTWEEGLEGWRAVEEPPRSRRSRRRTAQRRWEGQRQRRRVREGRQTGQRGVGQQLIGQQRGWKQVGMRRVREVTGQQREEGRRSRTLPTRRPRHLRPALRRLRWSARATSGWGNCCLQVRGGV